MSQYSSSKEGKTIVSDFANQVKGRTFLITGPSEGGIGAETAITLAHGSPSTILLLGRSLPKIQSTINTITSINPSIRTIFIPISLDSLTSVRAAAKTILSDPTVPKIDVVINNAAIMACPYSQSEDGYELQFATNHLSHFLLTNLLMPKMLAAGPGARIVNVSSWGHLMSDMHYSDVGFSNGRDYKPWTAYGQAKTANILFTVGLNQRLQGKGARSFALHPGSVQSGLQKNMTKELGEEAVAIWKELGQEMPERKTLQQGCATTLRAALDPSLEGEKRVFLQDCQVWSKEEKVRGYAVDEGNARKCWELSEKMVGEKFEY
jgi:NAD(P)-dependent dehydrogenase (short-subunit alcohol dehydrogenase family)